jgi:putative cofactor-binding repeat protein
MSRGQPLLGRTEWSLEQLEEDRDQAVEEFRQSRMREPLEAYLEAYDKVAQAIVELLEDTTDLAELDEQVEHIVRKPQLLEAFRYLTAPPISLDDLTVLTDAPSLTVRTLQSRPDLLAKLIETIRAGLDPKRFPWVLEARLPNDHERHAAIVASSSLMAVRRVETSRRTEGKAAQEENVRQALLAYGIEQVSIAGNVIDNLSQAPKAGQFSTEVTLGSRKADFVVGLWDQRIMAIECKVSNSALNSVKRLNNDAAAKAEAWTHDFGTRNIVPAAVLSGVYKLHNLQDAQRRGLTLYWAHRLNDLTAWIERTHRR